MANWGKGNVAFHSKQQQWLVNHSYTAAGLAAASPFKAIAYVMQQSLPSLAPSCSHHTLHVSVHTLTASALLLLLAGKLLAEPP
jgi:hypothetical protein